MFRVLQSVQFLLKVILDDDIKNQLGRWGHTFTAIAHSEGLIEVIMFGGSPGLYEVTWDVYKRKDFLRLSFPASFILGEPILLINYSMQLLTSNS